MKNPSEIFERMFEECDVDVEFTDCSVKQPKCAYCGKEVSRDAFHIWNTLLYCSTECFGKAKKIKKEKKDAKSL